MTNGPVSSTSVNTNEALTRADYEKIRETHDRKMREELGKESEKDRQKRLYIEENRRREQGSLGS